MKLLEKMSLENLIEQWEIVSKMKVTSEIATVRGWILEALEEKAPDKMDAYYDGFYEDAELRKVLLG